MQIPYKTIVQLIQDGQPVDAAHTNVPITDLAQRTAALKQILDALEAGQILRIDDVTLQAGMSIGTPVYLDVDNVFKPAATALANNSVGGALAAVSYVYGILIAKDSDTLGSLALGGRLTSLSTDDWAVVMEGGEFAVGHYWLSAITEGKISLSPGPLAIYIGQAKEDGSFLVRLPAPNYGAHEHDHFVLVGKPAGTVVDPGVGEDQTIDTPDSDQRGWLPAEAPYFDPDHIPDGAVFGYNFAPTEEDPLRAAFPPVPLDGVTFEQDGLILPDTKVIVNEFGIWWLDNSYGNAPWPVDYADTSIADDIDFWFSRLLFATANSLVTRLELHPDSVLNIEILNPSDQLATAGNLKLRVLSVLEEVADDDDGNLAVKDISGGGFTRGPTINRLFPGPGVTLSAASGSAIAGFYGDVIVSASASSALQGEAEVVNLANAREDTTADVQMVVLPTGRTAGPIFTMSVSALAPATSTMRLKAWLYCDKSGTVPAGVTVEYRIVPAPTSNTVLPTGWTSLTTLEGTAVVSGQSKQFDLDEDIESVPSGAIVLVRINRVSSDGFNGSLGLIRLGYALIP